MLFNDKASGPYLHVNSQWCKSSASHTCWATHISSQFSTCREESAKIRHGNGVSRLRMKVTLCIIGTEVWVYGDFFFYRKQRCFWQLVNVLALVHRHLPGLVFSFLAPFWDFPCAKNKLRKHIYAHAIFGISFDKMSESVKVLKRLEAGCKIDFPSLLHN